MLERRSRSLSLMLLVFMGSLGMLSACAGPKKSATRRVSEEEYMFYSSANPRLKVSLPSEWEFLGKIEQDEYESGIGVSVGALSYVWGDVQENIVRQGFVVRILTIPETEDVFWASDIFSGVTKRLEAGTREIAGLPYDYVTTVLPEPLADYEEQFIMSAGYTLPHFFIMHALGQLDSTKKVKSYLMYFNYVDSAEFNGFLKEFVSDEWDETNLGEDERRLLQEFLEQFQQKIQFLPFEKADS